MAGYDGYPKISFDGAVVDNIILIKKDKIPFLKKIKIKFQSKKQETKQEERFLKAAKIKNINLCICLKI